MIVENGHAEAKMREAGLQVTPQRRAVWSVFGEGGHLAADEAFARARRRLPELSRATVYNTLAAFVQAGILQVVESPGAALYDPNLDPDHHHFRCRNCDRLYDVPVEGVEGLRISGAKEFVVDQTIVLLRGLCPLCYPVGGGPARVPAFSASNGKVQLADKIRETGRVMTEDKSIKKVSSKTSPKGEMGQKYLADGKAVSMRLWDGEEPSDPKPEARRDYETVGYVVGGRAELHLEGQMVLLEPGDSWLVPKGASHTYNILESFTAVEATSPPAEVYGRDEG